MAQPEPQNQNAAKPEAEKASSFLYIRALPKDKGNWVRAAKRAGQNLTAWATEVLNKAAK